jgi:cell wall-associated NlpC family hydrolase
MKRPAGDDLLVRTHPAGKVRPVTLTTLSFDTGRARRAMAWFSALAVLLLLGACGTPPGVRGTSVFVPSRVSPEEASDVTVYAIGLVGTPYRFGGNTPDAGFDCSGLIGHVYKTRTGMALPRSVAGLQHWGQPLAAEEIRSGDLVFFGRGDVPTHAGIYVGNGRFVHAPSSGGTVRLDPLSARYWAAQRVTFRRP